MKTKSLLMIILMICSIGMQAQQKCYETFRDEGIKNFDLSKYQAAIDNFDVANDCEDKPEENDILLLIFNSQSCKNFKTMADSLFKGSEFEVASL